MVNSDISYLIQHSASIDPGNSGGPLLVKDEKNEQGFSVIGVNTWTITNRQNTFFAIPSKNIPQLIKKAKNLNSVKTQKDSVRSMLVTQANIFAAEINSEKPNWGKVMNYISYAYVGNKGWDSFLKVVEEGDTETLKQLDSKFFEYSPIEAMRFSILYRIWKKLNYNNKLTIQFKGINAADEEQLETAKTVRTDFVINGKEQEIEWYFEHGHWRISNFNLERPVAKNHEPEAKEEAIYGKREHNNGSSVYIGLDMFFTPFSQTFNPTLNDNFKLMGTGGTFSINFGERTSIYTRVSSLNLNNEMKNPPETLTSARIKYFHVNHGIVIYVGSNKLRPYFIGGINYFKFSETGTSNNVSATNKFDRYGLQLGTGLKFKFNHQLGLFAQATYNSGDVIPVLFADSYNRDLSNFQTSVGLSFDFKKK